MGREDGKGREDGGKSKERSRKSGDNWQQTGCLSTLSVRRQNTKFQIPIPHKVCDLRLEKH